MIEQLHRLRDALRHTVSLVFLPGYDMGQGRILVAGVDVWLNPNVA